MKKILFSVALLLSVLNSRAQQTYTQVQDSLMQQLDKALIPTGILYDRVYPWASLTHINSGVDTLDYDYVKQAWYELELASYTLTDGMHTFESITERIRQNTTDGKGISIGYVDVTFNSIDSNAITNGALIISSDGLWYDGGSTIGAPSAYLSHHIQLPLIATDVLGGDSVKFYSSFLLIT
jgi:hypothetical protein